MPRRRLGGAGRPVGDAAVGQPGHDGVPDPDRPLRVATAVDADDDVVVAPDRRCPDAGARGSSARAQKIRPASASAVIAAFTSGASVAATAYQAPSRSPGS